MLTRSFKTHIVDKEDLGKELLNKLPELTTCVGVFTYERLFVFNEFNSEIDLADLTTKDQVKVKYLRNLVGQNDLLIIKGLGL